MYSKLKKLGDLLDELWQAMEQRAKDSERQMLAFGIFGFIAYPLYYLINLFLVAPQAYTNLTLRLIASLLCLGLILKNYWPESLRRYLPIYWYLTLLYGLPFFFSFMLLKNDASSAWIMNGLTVLFLLMWLVDWISYIVLMAIGITLGWLAYYFTTPKIIYHLHTINYMDLINTYLVSLIMGLIFSRNKDLVEKGKLQAMRALGASLAHELRTPLAAINACAGGIREYLPDLISTYELAKKSQLPIPTIRNIQFETLRTSVEGIEAETNFANSIIRMLLVRAEEPEIKISELKVCSIKSCVEEALLRYPFISNEKNLVHCVIEKDFYFKGKELLTIHILFNLLRNAIYYVKAAGKGDIRIWVKQDSQYNFLYFRDTGKGISAKNLPRIFDRFFSKTPHGSGVGLAFCKTVMRAYGGDIICKSVEGEYTEFILSFPIIPSDEINAVESGVS